MTSIASLLDQLAAALDAAGATNHTRDWAQFEPATPEALKALEAEIGCALTDDLKAWLSHVHCELPLDGNYNTVSVTHIMERMRSTREIDFSQHHANITSWNDGRFDDQRLANTYWQPQWVGIATDGCGNEYCVDLAPGPNGEVGQLIAMEFQDGQGPYLVKWPSLEAMLEAHIAKLAEQRYFVDEEGFIEFDYD